MADEKQFNPVPTPELETAPISEDSSGLRDRRVRPEGVVPKQAQGYVVAGLAVLILMAVMFSKNYAKSATKEGTAAPVAVSTEMNQRKILELEQDLSADQRQSQKQAIAQRADATASPASIANATSLPQPSAAAPAAQLPPPVQAVSTEPPHDPIADAEKAMAFKARS
jgi:type IV secretion system protein VirB10